MSQRPSGDTTPERRIVAIDDLDLRFEPHAWEFAQQHAGEIAAHFQRRLAVTPALWNGRVLLLRHYALAAGRLSGVFYEVDYAAFLAWQDWGCPPAGAYNCFALGALRSADGAFLLGVMGPHTANAGRIYFPGGTPDPSDVTTDSRVDLTANVMRELEEETGLAAVDVVPEPGWTLCVAGRRLALIKPLRSTLTAAALQTRIERFLATTPDPELAAMRVARGPADIDPMMPGFMRAFLRRHWAAADASDDERMA